MSGDVDWVGVEASGGRDGEFGREGQEHQE